MHLLYSRFFHKALYDLALVPTAEPFNERYNRGLILGPDGAKMSKSKGNVINPDEVVQKHGADAVRTYLAFIGPYNEPGNYPWNLDGVEAMRRFLDRIAALEERVEDGEVSTELARAVMKAAKKVAEDSERFKLNTAVSAIMVVLKDFEALDSIPRAAYHDLLVLVAPFAPHLAEHLFAATGGEGSVHQASWPTIDSEILKDELVTISIQLNGKRKGEVQAAPDASEEEVLALAKTLNGVDAALSEGEKPARIIYISGRTLNIVSK
jgi:leucyl-tRNA synthetase